MLAKICKLNEFPNLMNYIFSIKNILSPIQICDICFIPNYFLEILSAKFFYKKKHILAAKNVLWGYVTSIFRAEMSNCHISHKNVMRNKWKLWSNKDKAVDNWLFHISRTLYWKHQVGPGFFVPDQFITKK